MEERPNSCGAFDSFVSLLETLTPDQGPELDQILDFAQKSQGRTHFDDDFSILKMEF
jgi:hypothetical protein